MKEEISIRVNIADVVYPLTVAIEDEENVRKAAKLIDEEVKKHREDYGISDKSNILSMIALKFASSLLHHQDNCNVENDEIKAQLKEINEMLLQQV